MKKTFKSLIRIVLVFILCLVLVGCGSSEAKVEKLSYVKMRINPEIELVLNEEGNVVAVNAVNEDGATVLAEINLIGLTVEEAGALFTSMAIELGFIDVDAENAIVYIFANSSSEEEEKEIEDKICDKIEKLFKDHGINGKVEKEDIENLKEIASEWQVSLKDAEIIKRVLELYPEMTNEEILELSFKEILELIKEDAKNNGIKPEHRHEYIEDVEELKEEYKELFEIKKQIKAIEKQLKDKTLSEEDKLALEAELKELKEEMLEEQRDFLEELEERKNDKIKKVKGLEAEFETLMLIRDELRDLETQLENNELSEEEKTTIQAEIELKKTEYQTLKEEYEAAIKVLEEEKKAKIQELKELHKEVMDLKKEIHDLEKQLRKNNLTEEEKTNIETLIEEKKAEYESVKAEYNDLKLEVHSKEDCADKNDDREEHNFPFFEAEKLDEVKEELEKLREELKLPELSEEQKEELEEKYEELLEFFEKLEENTKCPNNKDERPHEGNQHKNGR